MLSQGNFRLLPFASHVRSQRSPEVIQAILDIGHPEIRIGARPSSISQTAQQWLSLSSTIVFVNAPKKPSMSRLAHKQIERPD